jgi:hypothetical protein
MKLKPEVHEVEMSPPVFRTPYGIIALRCNILQLNYVAKHYLLHLHQERILVSYIYNVRPELLYHRNRKLDKLEQTA